MNHSPYTKENVSRGALHYLVGRGLAGVAGFLTVILLVRFMDVTNYAVYTALSGLAAMLGVLSSFGLDRVISRYLPEARLHRNIKELSDFIWLTTAFKLFVISLLISIIWLGWMKINALFHFADIPFFSKAFAVFVIADSLFQHFSSVLQSLVMQKELTKVMVIQWAGRLLMMFGLLFLGQRIDWENAFWIFAVPEFIGVCWFIVVVKRYLLQLNKTTEVKLFTDNWPDWEKVKSTAANNYGFSLLAAPPQGYFMKTVSAIYLPADYIAAYGFFLSLAEKFRQYIPLHFFYNLIEPVMIAGYLKDQNFDALSKKCQVLYKSNLLIMIPAIAIIAVSGDYLDLLLTGGKFTGLYWVMMIVFIQLTVGSHIVLLQLILNSVEKSALLVKACLYALPIMIVGLYSATKINSKLIFVCPILFSLVMNVSILIFLDRLGFKYKVSEKMIVNILLSAVMAFAVTKLTILYYLKSYHSHFLIGLSFIEVAIVYLVAIFLFKVINQSEINLVKTMINKGKG